MACFQCASLQSKKNLIASITFQDDLKNPYISLLPELGFKRGQFPEKLIDTIHVSS